MGPLWCSFLFSVTLLLIVRCEEITLPYSIPEEQPTGTFVGNIARDSELYAFYAPEDFQRLNFALFTQASTVAAKFTIDESTSTLRTAARLDREVECEGQKVCTLSIDVEVYMTNPLTNIDDLKKIIRVHVNLEDINDNAPTFPEDEVNLNVPESIPIGEMLLTSGAVDKDTGANNSIAPSNYELIPENGMFKLKVIETSYGPADLGLEVKHSLDRETRDLFQMVVVAKDGGHPRRSGSMTINVHVTDVNDNRPLFIKSEFNVTVPENSPINTAILTLTANDPDSGKNGELFYRFSARTTESVRSVLSIDEKTGQISPIKKLDYEKEKEYIFVVEVTDLGTPSLSSQATVNLKVADVNDNAPQIIINLRPSDKDISEATEFGTFIAHVSVFDADSGKNGEVSCEIHDDHFILQKFSDFEYYKILLQKPLDYEQSPTHEVNITCTDKGLIPRRNSSSFTVKVKDVNDNAPLFPSSRILAHIRENNRYSDMITRLTATDPDGPGNNEVIYSVTEDRYKMVNLDPTSGEVRANRIYDRERMPSFEVQVKAQDARDATLFSTAVLVVFIDDDNDQSPTFTIPHFTFYVSEKQPIGAIVGKLNATDRDVNQSYSFMFAANTNASKVFRINGRTGIITNRVILDRENRRRYDFGVIVHDPSSPGFNDTANVTVSIRDWNDNVPIVVFPSDINNTVYVSFRKAVGSIILIVQAYDNDTDDNAKLTYTIEQGNEKQLFFLNMMSGEMIIAKEMHSTDAGTYKLVVAAHDSGNPQLTSYANLNIIVTAANGTIPGFVDNNDAHQYIAIVITLVCVTAVLCVAVVITICIIKKIDKERRQTLKEKIQTQAAAYTVGNVETVEKGVSPNKPNENEIEKLKKKIKRELSFTVDDSEHLDTTEVTGASFGTFKNMTSYSSIDQKTLANPQASSSVLTNNTHTPEHTNVKMAHYAEKKREIHRLASERLHEHPSDSAHWLSDTEVKKADDVTSELSQGAETDSGRGCSEEDSQSNRGSTVPHSDTEDVKSYSPRYQPGRGTYSQSRDNNHDTTRSTLSQLSLRSVTSPRIGEHDHYTRNISFSDDSVTANTTVDAKRKKRVHSDSIPMQTFSRNQTNASHTPYHLRSMNRVRFSGHTPHQGTYIDVTQSTPGLRYSMGDMDDVLCDSAITDNNEDDRTTTSGSYTINAEELCNEIDNLFFKDIIV